MAVMRPLLALFVALALAACSSTTAPGDAADASDAASNGDTVGSDGSDVTATDVPVTMTACPPMPPSAGTTCTREGLVCTFGDDPRASCRTRATCTSATWAITSPRCVPLPTDCPATPSAGAVCGTPDNVCAYADGTRCNCAFCPLSGPACMPTPPPHYFCVPPPSNAQCPRLMPNLGDACTSNGVQCDYDGCGSGMTVECTNNVWVQALTACPA